MRKDYGNRKAGLAPPFCEDDDDKDERNRTGDVAIWLELIAKCTANPQPVIFVTGDLKMNWWADTGERDVPQPALVQEFFKLTGHAILFFTPPRFLSAAPNRLHLASSPSLTEEAKELGERNRRLHETLHNHFPAINLSQLSIQQREGFLRNRDRINRLIAEMTYLDKMSETIQAEAKALLPLNRTDESERRFSEIAALKARQNSLLEQIIASKRAERTEENDLCTLP